MAQLADIVFDCAHAPSIARFWEAVLDDYAIAPYDDAELQRLAALGFAGPEEDPTVMLKHDGGGPTIWFQQVDEPKLVKNRVHLDVRALDVAVEVTRLLSLGATRSELQPAADLTVMQDPEGNEFCVIAREK